MDKKNFYEGAIINLDDGRKVKISKIHPDLSFEWDLVEEAEESEEITKDESKETVKVEIKKKTSKKTKEAKKIT